MGFRGRSPSWAQGGAPGPRELKAFWQLCAEYFVFFIFLSCLHDASERDVSVLARAYVTGRGGGIARLPSPPGSAVDSRRVFCLFGDQRTDVMQKVDYFRNKKFLIVHGTADGNIQTASLCCCLYAIYTSVSPRPLTISGREKKRVVISYGRIDDLHWKTDRQAASLI